MAVDLALTDEPAHPESPQATIEQSPQYVLFQHAFRVERDHLNSRGVYYFGAGKWPRGATRCRSEASDSPGLTQRSHELQTHLINTV